jgi:hypothetical protein
MRLEATASSGHDHLVLYDPAAIPSDVPVDPDLEAQDPVPIGGPARLDLANRGLALILRLCSADCEATLRILVDEMPESFLRERAALTLDGALLRLPGGKLTIDGIEFLCRFGETRLHSEAEIFELPPGDYVVQVLNLIPWKEQNRTAEINRRTSRVDRLVNKAVQAYTWLGILLIPGNLLIAGPAVVVLLLAAGWRQALTLAAAIVVVDVLVLAGFWALDAASKIFPALIRAGDARLAFETENPDIVVCLQKAAQAGDRQIATMATIEIA